VLVTYLAFIAIDNHSHALHVDPLLRDAGEAAFELGRQRFEFFGRNGADINGEVDASCPNIFTEIEIRAEREMSPELED